MAKYIPLLTLWLSWGKHNPCSIVFDLSKDRGKLLHEDVRFYGFGLGKDKFIFGLFRLTNNRKQIK